MKRKDEKVEDKGAPSPPEPPSPPAPLPLKGEGGMRMVRVVVREGRAVTGVGGPLAVGMLAEEVAKDLERDGYVFILSNKEKIG